MSQARGAEMAATNGAAIPSASAAIGYVFMSPFRDGYRGGHIKGY